MAGNVDATPASIDDTLDGRCACGCGAVLTARHSSVWFASESCQQHWHISRCGATAAEDPLERLVALVQGFLQQVHTPIVAAFAALGRALQTPHHSDPEQVRQAALEARRNRNTGPPTTRQRPPKRIRPTAATPPPARRYFTGPAPRNRAPR